MTRNGSSISVDFHPPSLTSPWINPRSTPTCWVKPTEVAPTSTSSLNCRLIYLLYFGSDSSTPSPPSTPSHCPKELASSFGQWEGVDGGDGVELSEPKYNRYISLQFKDDVLVGATSVGLTQHVGVLRGLIQGEVRLGGWKSTLMDEPLRVMDAYLACAQKPMVLHG